MSSLLNSLANALALPHWCYSFSPVSSCPRSCCAATTRPVPISRNV